MKVNISVVIPVFNEEKNIPVLYKKLRRVLSSLTNSYEIIFINDASTDKSMEEIKKIRTENKKVKFISFSRNFGHMSALNAGITFAKGEKVILMDADLQDPPEIISKMYSKLITGYDVVYGIKTNRKEGLIKKSLFKTFYIVLNKISSFKMPLDSGTFSIMNKKVVDILKNLPERNKYLSGLRSWVGFKQTGITYERAKRYSGKASSLGKLVSLAINGFISFSYIPLRVASFFGFILAILSFMMILFVFFARFYLGWGIVGWTSTLTAILFIGGIQLITLGILGEYLARIYDEVKNRPEFIISEKSGF